MPSHFEPSGLSQLYSLAYGSVPIVRKTGGLADTVVDTTRANLNKDIATGIVFEPPTAEALVGAVRRACTLFQDKQTYHKVQTTGMREDFSWERAAKAYINVYRQAVQKMR